MLDGLRRALWQFDGWHGPGLDRLRVPTLTLLILSATFVAGCNFGNNGVAPAALPNAAPAATPSDADTAFTLPRVADGGDAPAAAPARPRVELAVIYVRVPSYQHDAATKLWNYLREDGLDAETTLRLRDNGFRVGVGNEEFWPAVKAALDAIPGVEASVAAPVRLPAGFPLALELDDGPREQTLFQIDREGMLAGSTWLGARNVLVISFQHAMQSDTRLNLRVAPELRQRLEGYRWVRTEAGLAQLPKHNSSTFTNAAFVLDVDAREFVLVAPSENASIAGLLGAAFMRKEVDGIPYDCYVFLRPQVMGGENRG